MPSQCCVIKFPPFLKSLFCLLIKWNETTGWALEVRGPLRRIVRAAAPLDCRLRARGPGYLLGNKADPGVSLWESKEEFSDKGKMFSVKFRGGEYDFRTRLSLQCLQRQAAATAASPQFWDSLINQNVLSLSVFLPCQWIAYLSRQGLLLFPKTLLLLHMQGSWVVQDSNQLFSWLSVFFGVRWEGKCLFYFFCDCLVS